MAIEGAFSSLQYLADPLDSLGIGGNEGCMCYYWMQPQIVIENLIEDVKEFGIPYTTDQQQQANNQRLFVDIKRANGVVFATYILQDSNGVAATLKLRKRVAYPLEPEFGTERMELDNSYARLQYLAHGNFWNQLANSLLTLNTTLKSVFTFDNFRRRTLSPVQQFLKQSILVENGQARDTAKPTLLRMP